MTDTDTDTDTTNATTKSGRGRKKIDDGGKPSPRQIFVSCFATVNGKNVLEDVHCIESDKDTKDSEVIKEAKALFENKHGVAPALIGKPHFPRKEVGVTRKRDTLSIDMEDVVFDRTRKGQAVHRGWKVGVKFIENNDDAVYIIYKSHTQEEKKVKPANKVVRIDALENLVEDGEEQETQDSAE
jgi:hypothetical protein